jgi:hypothetical protein
MSDKTFERSLRILDRAKRTAAIASWFQGLYPERETAPILVGGGAVELFTGGAYTTGDLDFVGFVPAAVARRLEAAGFRREGRHWIHRAGMVFLELPGSQLEPQERAVWLRSGRLKVRTISPEDLIVDRLASWQFWGSSVDAVNAYLLFRNQRRRLDLRRLRRLALTGRVERAHRELMRFVRHLGSRRAVGKELELWADQKLS